MSKTPKIKVTPLNDKAYHPYNSKKKLSKDGEVFDRLCTRLARQQRQGFIKIEQYREADNKEETKKEAAPVKKEEQISKEAESEPATKKAAKKAKAKKSAKGHQSKPATTDE